MVAKYTEAQLGMKFPAGTLHGVCRPPESGGSYTPNPTLIVNPIA